MSAIKEDAAAGGSPVRQHEQRFSLLYLQEEEYLFRDHAAYMWDVSDKRIQGHLEIASLSLYFVPRDVKQPILRLPFKATSAIELLSDKAPSGEDMFLVVASEQIEMLAGNKPAPYVRQTGKFALRFSLVYTSLDDVLPGIQDLRLLASKDGSKAERAETKALLQQIIEEHEDSTEFSSGWLEDDDESVLVNVPGACVSPLAEQPGRCVLTQRAIYFQPFSVISQAPIQAYPLSRMEYIAHRTYQLEDLGLEIFFSGRSSLYLIFRAHADRDTFSAALRRQPVLQLERMRSRDRWTRDWVAGRVSNYAYLLHLNREAGRSFKDLTQYPVMPWVVADYTSPTLDLNDPATFRDLSKPVGALSPRRLAEFQERFVELQKMARGSGDGARDKATPGAPPPIDMPPFLYGCHYSSPGYVVFYLMRSDPQLMLRLQNGRFDAPDRLFWSIQDTWKSVTSLPTDVKELIPEFYSTDASFLVNHEGVDFGKRAGGEPVGDVVLPPWASDAQDFCYKLAEALESPYVSARLHKWIDLVFGRKSRGQRAEKADNVFHYLTYDEIAQRYLEQEQDPVMRQALRLQMMEFGRTPRQLFTRKHPKRAAGMGPLAACLCLAPTIGARPVVPRPANPLTGKGFSTRGNIPPVSRAVFKLAGPRADKRAACLAWLEEAAATQEPNTLTLRHTRGAELVLLVRFVRDAREGRAPGGADERAALDVLARAARALAVSSQNRRYLLDSGALELVVDALLLGEEGQEDAQGSSSSSSRPPDGLSGIALQALAMLSREDDTRLHVLPRRALLRVVDVVRRPPGSNALLAALACIAQLSGQSASIRLFFAEQGVLPHVVHHLSCALAELAPGAASAHAPRAAPSATSGAAPDPGSRPASAMSTAPLAPRPSDASVLSTGMSVAGGQPPGAGLRRMATLGRQGRARVAEPLQVAEASAQVLAALLQDEPQKEALLDGGHLPVVLQLCGTDGVQLQAAGFTCLASLATTEGLRQQAAQLELLPMVLQQATCGVLPVQRPAAACVVQLCADPPLVLAALAPHSGLAAVVAMALSPDPEVQRHAARSLWHLMVQPDSRARVVGEGALSALLALVQGKRNVAARTMAQQALRLCAEDPALRGQLEAAAATRGLSSMRLAELLSASISRLSSLGARSASDAPSSSASPHATTTPSTLHRQGVSDLPSIEGISRASSLQQISLSPAVSARGAGTPTASATSPDTPRMFSGSARSQEFVGGSSANGNGSALVAPSKALPHVHASAAARNSPQLSLAPSIEASGLPSAPGCASGMNGGGHGISSGQASPGAAPGPQPLEVPSSQHPVALPFISPVVAGPDDARSWSRARKQLSQDWEADAGAFEPPQSPGAAEASAACSGKVGERLQQLRSLSQGSSRSAISRQNSPGCTTPRAA